MPEGSRIKDRYYHTHHIKTAPICFVIGNNQAGGDGRDERLTIRRLCQNPASSSPSHACSSAASDAFNPLGDISSSSENPARQWWLIPGTSTLAIVVPVSTWPKLSASELVVESQYVYVSDEHGVWRGIGSWLQVGRGVQFVKVVGGHDVGEGAQCIPAKMPQGSSAG